MKIADLIILLEDRIDFIKKLFLSKIEKYLPVANIPDDIKHQISNQHGESNEEKFFNWVMNKDPTNKKIYTQWLLNCILKNDMPLEDAEYSSETLIKFDEIKKTLPPDKRDINSFKTLSELYTIINDKENEYNISNTKEEHDALKQSDIIYNGPDLLVLHPKTQYSACYFGKSTGWCTAWGDHLKLGLSSQGKYPTRTNRFEYYEQIGPSYIVIDKRHPDDRWQFNYRANQFMDKYDHPIDPHILAKLHPILWEIFYPISEKNKSFILNKNPSDETIVNMGATYPETLLYLSTIKPELQIEIINKSRFNYVIQCIKNPSEEAKLTAVRKDANAIKFIKNPSENVQLAAVHKNPYVLDLIKNPSENVQLAAVEKAPNTIRGILNPSENIQLAAVKKSGDSIIYIQNPSEKVKLAAVREDGGSIHSIKNPSIEIQLAAVRKNPSCINWIKNPSEEVQLLAIKRSPTSIYYIRNPTDKVKKLAAEYKKKKEQRDAINKMKKG